MSDQSQPYSLDDLHRALLAADAAGDTESATALAQHIQQLSQVASPAVTLSGQSVPTTQETPYRGLKMVGNALADVGQNLLGLTGIAQQGFDAVQNKLGLPIKTGLPGWMVGNPEGNVPARFPTPSDLNQLTGLGLENRPDLAPRNGFEKAGIAGVEGAAMAVPSILSGGAILPSLALGIGTNEAAEGAHELWPDSTAAPLTAGVLTALAGGRITASMAESSAARAATEAENAAREAAESRLSQASDNLEAARSVKALQNSPTVGAPAVARAIIDSSNKKLEAEIAQATGQTEAVNTAADKTVANTAAALGKSSTPQQGATALQNAAVEWKTTEMPAKLAAVGDPLRAKLPDTTEASLYGTAKALDDMNAAGGKLQAVLTKLVPNLPARLQASLGEALDSPAGNAAIPSVPVYSKTIVGADGMPVQTGVTTGRAADPVTVGEIRQFRSAVGSALSIPGIVNDVGEQNLRHLYAALTGDYAKAAQAAGAGDLFNQFNTESTKLYNFAAGPLSKVISTTSKAPFAESIVPESLPGSLGATDLAQLRTEPALAKGVNEFAAGQIRDPGFKWESQSPEYKAALTGDPAMASALDQTTAARSQAKTAEKAALDMAGKDHAATVEAAKQDLADGRWTRTEAVRQANLAAAKAKADLPPPAAPPPPAPSKADQFFGAMQRALPLAGGALGIEHAGPILNALGLSSSTPLNAAIGLTTAAAPYIYGGVKRLVTNPNSWVNPLTGVVAGENALAPPESP